MDNKPALTRKGVKLLLAGLIVMAAGFILCHEIFIKHARYT